MFVSCDCVLCTTALQHRVSTKCNLLLYYLGFDSSTVLHQLPNLLINVKVHVYEEKSARHEKQ